MKNLQDQAQPVMEYLLQADSEELFQELGQRLQVIQVNPAIAGSFDVPSDVAEESLGLSETVDNLRAFGRAFFQRVNKEAYSLVCGNDAEQTEERKTVIVAFGLGPEAVASSIAALLVSQFGMAPAISAVVAALVVKLFFNSVHGAMCDVWRSKIAVAPP